MGIKNLVYLSLVMNKGQGEDETPLTEAERDRTILTYEKFINERLKVDMDQILTERDKVYEELSA